MTNINNPELIEVFDADFNKIALYNILKQIISFEYHVDAYLDAIERGSSEFEELPHSEIIAVM